MSENWTEEELTFCVRTYLWMLESEQKGLKLKKKRIEQALIAGPLYRRTRLDRRYANIAYIMQQKGLPLLTGFKPQANVGANVTPIIDKAINDYLDGDRHHRRLDCLVKQIPEDAFREAADRLISGEDFAFSDSREYDVDYKNSLIPPKKITALASEIWYGAKLGHDNFQGAKTAPAFERIESSGLRIRPKNINYVVNPESTGFRKEVARSAKSLKEPPRGNEAPVKHQTTTEQYERDPAVVAYTENLANGICQLCNNPAPFITSRGRPFLEVHHILPLSEGGKDVVENAVALCPNCHRMCHYSSESANLRKQLLAKQLVVK